MLWVKSLPTNEFFCSYKNLLCTMQFSVGCDKFFIVRWLSVYKKTYFRQILMILREK